MDENKNFLFAVSKTGASHLPKGVPCQDYSLSWASDDGKNSLIIVCDGHGSPTYVRSDRGSRMAAEIAKDSIISFIDKTDPALFVNFKGAVTARPSLDKSMWGKEPQKPLASMTEVELLIHKQNQLFYQQIQGIGEQDVVLFGLFEEIYQKWLDAIMKDSQDDPFNDEEQKALADHKIVKAYGTTLMAFVQTPLYWLSFHIGDGRILMADRGLNWSQPVPWDCNCFQNLTTSLCNTNPLKAFRYAFDGTGAFPVATLCCSDGIEDSYGDFDLAPNYLYNFYNGLLNALQTEGGTIFIEKLSEFLPKLSDAGSKDDASLAGIINLGAISDGLIECELLRQRDKLNNQHDERMKKQQASQEKLEQCQQELEMLKQKLELSKQKKESIIEQLKKILLQEESLKAEETEENSIINDYQEQINAKTEALDKMQIDIDEEIENNRIEDDIARSQKAELKHQYDEIEVRISELQEADLANWKELVSNYFDVDSKDSESTEEQNIEAI